MNLDNRVQTSWARLHELVTTPLVQFYRGLDDGERTVLYGLLAVAAIVGLVIGRLRVAVGGTQWGLGIGGRRFRAFQNIGEASVSRVLASHFGPPDFHLMNHVTLRLDDGTTEVDHILVSRFGVFVIETKHYTGWLFANEAGHTWTQVRFRRRFKFQNPMFQNARHVRAVSGLLDFLSPGTIKSVVVFSGSAEFKTEIPPGVIGIGQLAEYIGRHTEDVMSLNRLQFCVGRLETARLALSGKTDVEHIQSLARRHGQGAA